MKKILVLGGSYFVGRIFTILAAQAGHHLTLVNRGRYSMLAQGAAQEFHFDRHDSSGWSRLPQEDYDVVVDFCGYKPGDVAFAAQHLRGGFGQYLFVSTCDVYDRATPGAKDEGASLLTSQPPCNAGEYMYHKMLLEGEVEHTCHAYGSPFTIVRPAFIYGPYNYAPRESYYIEKIVRGQPIPAPADADSAFQFVYVRDVCEAILLCCGHPRAADECFNLCGPEIMTYPGYLECLRTVSGLPFPTYSVTVQDVMAQQIPLPFPLHKGESELFDGSKITRQLDFSYTPFQKGMELTWRAFQSVYSQQPLP